MLSHVQLFVNPWTVAHQTPLLMGFSRQKYWSGLPFPSPWNLPDQGIKHGSSELQMDPLPSEPQGTPQYLFFFNYWFTPIDNRYLFNYYRFRYSVQLSFSMVSDSLQPRGQKLRIWLFNACFNKATCCLHLYSNIPLSSYPWDPSRLAITHSLCC